MIKEVDSDIFNAGLDKWINLSLGILPDNWRGLGACAYCDMYLPDKCGECPIIYRTY